MIRFKEAIVEPGLHNTVVVLARTDYAQVTRVIAEIEPAPTSAKPFRVKIRFTGRRGHRYSANLGSAVMLISREKGIERINVRHGTADVFYGVGDGSVPVQRGKEGNN